MSFLKSKLPIILPIILAAALLVLPELAQARGLVPCGGPTEHPCTVEDMFFGVARVTNWLIMVAGIFAVFEILNGGFWLITTMGNEEGLTKHKNTIRNAVIGFVFVMLAYVLVNTAVNGILADGNCKYQLDLRNPFKYIQGNNNCATNP